jgi:hypothetical protein
MNVNEGIPSYRNELERFLTHMIMWEMGIVPLDELEGGVDKILVQMSPEDEKSARRKFRKIWRNLSKSGNKNFQKYTLGRGSNSPTPWQKLSRKRMVQYEVMRVLFQKIREIKRKSEHSGESS